MLVFGDINFYKVFLIISFMSLKDVVNSEIAERVRRVTEEGEYVGQIAEDNYDVLRRQFEDGISEMGLNADRVVYIETLRCILSMEEYTGPATSSFTNPEAYADDILAKLGWLTIRPGYDGAGHGSVSLSDEGLKVLNGLRKIRGECSVEEGNKRFLKRFGMGCIDDLD